MQDDALPLIGVSCCFRPRRHGSSHVVGDKYVDSVVDGAGGMPVLVPALAERLAIDPLIDRLDGLLLTGSPSNVDPAHYGGPAPRPDNEDDVVRDGTTLPLIRKSLAAGLPVLAICRGIQEVNVALGGTLHPHVHEVEGRRDHRSNKTLDYAARYATTHDVRLRDGGLLQSILGGVSRIAVNSLHGQAIDRIAADLVVEGLAEDGTIEAVSHKHARGFFLGVQWHPEWQVRENQEYFRIFAAFGDACRERAAQRSGRERLGRVA